MPKDASKSSLEALLPGSSNPEGKQPPGLRSSKACSSIPAVNELSAPPDGSMAPDDEVAYLSRVVFQICCNKTPPRWLREHISPAFRADFDNFPASQTWEEHVETFRIIHRTNPDYVVEIGNMVVDVSDHNTHADALLLIETWGRPENVRRHSTARLKWRRRDGRWEIYHIWGVRAPFATFDNI